jgi:hypothetical protein
MRRSTAEQSKLYRILGYKLGYKLVKFTHRGIIAKNILSYIDTLELQNFKTQLKHINILDRNIKVNNGNETYYI